MSFFFFNVILHTFALYDMILILSKYSASAKHAFNDYERKINQTEKTCLAKNVSDMYVILTESSGVIDRYEFL